MGQGHPGSRVQSPEPLLSSCGVQAGFLAKVSVFPVTGSDGSVDGDAGVVD